MLFSTLVTIVSMCYSTNVKGLTLDYAKYHDCQNKMLKCFQSKYSRPRNVELIGFAEDAVVTFCKNTAFKK